MVWMRLCEDEQMPKRKTKNFNTNPTNYLSNDPLLRPTEAATERKQAISTFWRDVRLGVVPPPIYIGAKSPRWRLSSIRNSEKNTKKAFETVRTLTRT